MNLEKVSATTVKEESLLSGLKAISDDILQFLLFINITFAGPESATAVSKSSSLSKPEIVCSFSKVSFSIGADFMTVINNTRRKIFIFEKYC